MEHYYTDKKNISENSLVITGDESKHLIKVLRKSKGEEIYVTDGERNLYKTIINQIRKDEIICDITEKLYNVNEPEIRVTLYQSLLKNPSRFEFALEKATELGVHEITPLVTHNVVNKEHDKQTRWQQIVLSAIKQSQRCYLPVVNHPVYFTDAIKIPAPKEVRVIADERSYDNSLSADEAKRVISGKRPASVFIGPEGGFTAEEVNNAFKNGFTPLNLGERKLRSETAGIAALSIILSK